MGRAEVLQEVRRIRFENLLDRQERGQLSQIAPTTCRSRDSWSGKPASAKLGGGRRRRYVLRLNPQQDEHRHREDEALLNEFAAQRDRFAVKPLLKQGQFEASAR